MIAEHADKLSDEDKQGIETAQEELKKAAEGDDKAAIEAALSTFQTKAQKLGEIIYPQSQAEQAAAGGAPGPDAGASDAGSGSNDDEPVDADFEVKN